MRLGGVLLILGLAIPPALSGQTASPEERVRQLVLQAREMVEGLELDWDLRNSLWTLNRLSRSFGLEEFQIPPLPRPSAPEIRPALDTLLNSPSPQAALELTFQRDQGDDLWPSARRAYVRALIRNGQTKEILDALAAVDSVTLGLWALLFQTEASPSDREAAFRDWHHQATLSEAQNGQARRFFLTWLASWDKERALQEIREEERPDIAGPAMVGFLRENWGDVPQLRDGLLIEAINLVSQIEDKDLREDELIAIEYLCGEGIRRPCPGLELPASERFLPLKAEGFMEQVRNGNFQAADSALEVLEGEGTREASLLALVARGITRGCRSGSRACREVARLWEGPWIPRLETFAEKDLPEADTVRAGLAEFWAPVDAARATRWLAAVEDPQLARQSSHAASQTALQTDLWGAVDLVRAGKRPGHPIIGLPGSIYTELKRIGENEVAEELLGFLGSDQERLAEELQWVQTLLRAGQVRQAQALAGTALEEWDPVEGSNLGPVMFRVFHDAELEGALMEWLDELAPGREKAAALIGIAEGIAAFNGILGWDL